MTLDLSYAEYNAVTRSDFATFNERAFYVLNPHERFIAGAHIDLLAAMLDQCRTKKKKRLIINAPPRGLKSHMATIALPAWLLGHDPAAQIICASYGQHLADKFARDCRTVINSVMFRELFPETVLSLEKHAAADFMTTMHGCRLATSVGGPVTGRGGEFLIVDDILKPAEALSDKARQNANDWYRNSLLSRLNSKKDGVIIIVMQRLHESDLVGEVLESEEWEVLSLPAIAMTDEVYPYMTPFGRRCFMRKAGEVLHPERDSIEAYEEIRRIIGNYEFQSQYQQDPLPPEGGWIRQEWLCYYEPHQLPREFTFILQSWDTACKTGDMNDFSVGTTWGVEDGKYYLLDVCRAKLDFPELKRAVIAAYQKYRPSKILIEDKASGTALIQELQREFIYGIEPFQPPSGSDKRSRFAAQAIRFEAGEVFLPSRATWLEEYVREITGFPGTRHDDQVDSTTQALENLAHLAPLTKPSVPWLGFRPYVRETC